VFSLQEPVIGIDPGQSGAIALVRGYDDCAVWSMPADDDGIISLLSALKPRCWWVFIERQQSFPQQGVASTFKTGERYGFLKGVAQTLGYRVHIIDVRTWKKSSGIAGAQDQKAASRSRASELFPSLRGELEPKSSHGKADAILVAMAGAEQFGLLLPKAQQGGA